MRERVRIGSRYGRSGYGAETCDTVIWLKGYVMFRNLKTLMCEMRVVIFYGGSHVRGSSLDDNGGKSGKSGDFKSARVLESDVDKPNISLDCPGT